MKILAIETSCDETAVSIVEAQGTLESPSFTVLGNALLSQIDIHKEYGGVFPMLAKREHAKNLPILLKKVLEESKLYKEGKDYPEETWSEIKKSLEKETDLYEGIKNILGKTQKPDIDVITVTSGPGLEPALWVGITGAQTLGKLWKIPVVGANHMEGHIASVLINQNDRKETHFPALALLISGGHTELVEIKNWGEYKVIGHTLDDAVGEAFDKVARMMDLPYPGGPQISKLAEGARANNTLKKAKFSRPMIHSHDLNFSFSGLKTAVLYYIRDHGPLSDIDKTDIAREFEDTVVDVLILKTTQAIEQVGAKTLIIGGGVIANKKLREVFSQLEKEYGDLQVLIPEKNLTTDNALMIACATYIELTLHPELLTQPKNIIAKGNLKLGD